jgi:hypothetical protein
MSKLRKRMRVPSPAMAVACMALAVALSGASYAAVVLPKNSVGTAQLKRNAVTSVKVRNDVLTGADVNEATLGQVPAANTATTANTANTATSANTANSANSAATAGNADNLDGHDASAFWRKTESVKVTPVTGQYSAPSIPLVAGTTHRFAPAFVAASNGVCLVRAESATFGGPNATGFHQIRTARKVNGGAAVDDGGWNKYVLPREAGMGTAGKSAIWSIQAGNSYEFGAELGASGDFVGDVAYPTVTYICFYS